jgi:inner membrane protein
VIGPFVHIALDFTNNYGVHPFWPVDNRWYYGDSVFIVEPLLWAVAIPSLLLLSRSIVSRVGLGLFLAASVVLSWTVGAVSTAGAALVTVAAALATLIAWRLSSLGRVKSAIAGWLAVTAVFVALSQRSEAIALRSNPPRPEGAAVLDVVLTPQPANPLCWIALIVEYGGSHYALRAATVAPLPAILPSTRCPRAVSRATTAPLTAVNHPSTAAVRWEGELVADPSDLCAIAASNCTARAYLRFARAPFWTAPGSEQILGDLRYDRAEGDDFAEIRPWAGPKQCPKYVPPWRYPRQDVIRAP